MAKALVVIDVQEGMQAEKGAYDGAGVIERIADLLERARKSGTKIIYVQHDGGAEPGHPLAKGTPGHAIHHAIAPKAGEAVVVKTQCSAFLGTTMNETLKKAGIDHLIVCGMQTEYCVDTSVRAAKEHGYKVTLVSDAHTTGDTPALKAKDIIAHHNLTLAGDFAKIVPAASVEF
jgi:nicotinamidase-related amidase